MTNEPKPNQLAWLLKNNPAFADAYSITQRIRAEEAANREQINDANLARSIDVRVEPDCAHTGAGNRRRGLRLGL